MTEPSQAQAMAREYLLNVIQVLRREFAARLKLLRTRFPGHKLPCETCAFRTSTDDWEGFDQTAINFVAALCSGPGHAFYCHHDMKQDKTGQWIPPMRLVNLPGGKRRLVPDERRLTICVAWSVLISTLPEPIDITRYIPDPMMRAAMVEIAREHSAHR